MWSLSEILQILYQLYRQADYRLPPVSRLIRERRLRFSGHVWTLNMISIGSLGRRSDHPVIGGDFVDAVVPAAWLGATDRPTDVRSVNIGIQSAWRKPSDRTLWRRIVDTANTLLEKKKVRYLQVTR